MFVCNMGVEGWGLPSHPLPFSRVGSKQQQKKYTINNTHTHTYCTNVSLSFLIY